MENKKIVFLYGSLLNLGWGRAQKFCEVFLKMGHKICYIEYPISMRFLFSKRKIFTKTQRGELDNLIRLFGLPIRRFRFFNNLSVELVKFQILRKIGKEFLTPDILWIYGVPDVRIVDIFSPKKSVYDCADDRVSRIAEQFGEKEADLFRENENKIIKRVDRVFAVSDTLLNEIRLRMKKEEIKKITLLNNGVDLDYFESAVNSQYYTPENMKNTKSPIVGYIGTKTYELDYELFESVVKVNPDLSFVLIGNVSKDVRRLLLHRNVCYLGYISYKILPEYIRTFDVCIVPFKPYKSVFCADPIKVIQYFAMGKPVVSTIKLGVREYDGLIWTGPDSKSFSEAIRAALNEDGVLSEKRISLAKSRTWDLIGKKALKEIFKD